MEENKNLNEAGITPIQGEEAASEPTAVVVTGETALETAPDQAAAIEIKPKKKQPIVLFAIIAVLVVAAIAMFAIGSLSSPEKAVKSAFAASVQSTAAQLEQLKKDIPMFEMMYDTEIKPSTTNFAVAFQSLDGNLPAEAKLLVKLLSGMGVRGSYVSDPQSSISELNSSIVIGETDLIGMYMFASPELLAGNVPTFSDTVLSINPKTFSADMQASPLFAFSGMTAEELEEFQTMINMQIESMNAAGDLDIKKMQDDMTAIVMKVLTNASYGKGVNDGGLKTYTVTIPGEDMKTAVIELLRYIYLDSPMAAIYESAFTPQMLGGMGYKDMMNQEVIKVAEEELPRLNTVVTVKVDKVIKAANAVIKPAADITGKNVMTVDYTLLDDGSETLRLAGTFVDDTETATFNMDLADRYIDGAYVVDMKMNMRMGEIVGFDLTQLMEMNKTGAYKYALNMKVQDEYGMNVDADIDLDGTISIDGEKVTYDFPKLMLAGGMGGEKYTANFTLRADSAPAVSPHTITKDAKPLFSMSEDDLMAEMAKYEAGSQKLVGAVLGMFLG